MKIPETSVSTLFPSFVMALLSAAYVLRQALSIQCLATDALLRSTIVISSWQSKHTSFEITQVKIQGDPQWPDLNYTLIELLTGAQACNPSPALRHRGGLSLPELYEIGVRMDLPKKNWNTFTRIRGETDSLAGKKGILTVVGICLLSQYSVATLNSSGSLHFHVFLTVPSLIVTLCGNWHRILPVC